MKPPSVFRFLFEESSTPRIIATRAMFVLGFKNNLWNLPRPLSRVIESGRKRIAVSGRQSRFLVNSSVISSASGSYFDSKSTPSMPHSLVFVS
jgi:hypothetical protein